MRRRHRTPDPEPDESKRWLDSYADAMTLLLAFFIMLFAFSLVDEDKFTEFKFGVAQALGKPNPTIEGGLGLLDRGNGIATMVAAPPVITENGDGSEGPDPDEINPSDQSDAEPAFDTLPDTTTTTVPTNDVTVPDGEQGVSGDISAANVALLAEELQARIDEIGADSYVELEMDPRGLIIYMDTKVLFASGSALIIKDGTIVLDSVANVLAEIDNPIIIEGHTDNVPTGGRVWPTNWELSVARAVNVLRYLIEFSGLPPTQVSAAGYADTRPRALNTTAEGRQLNRRVELIVLVPQETGGAPDGGGEEDDGSPPDVIGPVIDPGIDPGARPEPMP